MFADLHLHTFFSDGTYSPEELVARVVAVMRRTYRDAAVLTLFLRLGDLEIDILNRRVRAATRSFTSRPSSRVCSIFWQPTRAAC